MQVFRRREPADDPVSQWFANSPGAAYLALVVGVPLLGFLIFFSQMWYDDLRLERGGRETRAVIESIDPAQHGGHLFVRYDVRGREYHAETGLGDADYVAQVHLGDSVVVTYLPSHPAVVRAGHRPRGVLPGMAEFLGSVTLFVALFCFLPVYYLPTRRLRRLRAAETTASPG
jgi:hypothetical protein